MPKPKILFDCDTGSDDAIAMMMLLQATNEGKVETVGITCVSGNTSLSNAVTNNLRLLQLYNLVDKIPVFRGCSEPLVQSPSGIDHANSVHGSDGMGDAPHVKPCPDPSLLLQVGQVHAANAIVDLARKYEGHLTVVATGPLTNLAVALKLDPDLPSRVKSLYIMGGTREGEGNVVPAAEFNFYIDPEAAFTVLKNFPPRCETHLADYGFTCRYETSLDWIKNEWIGQHRNQKEEFADAVLGPLIKWTENRYGKNRGLVICDAYTMAMVLDPSVVTDPEGLDCRVELGGSVSRGHVVWNRTREKNEMFYGPVIMYGHLDVAKYEAMLKKAVA